MRYLVTILLFVSSFSTLAVDFTKVSRDEPITTVYPASFKCFVDISLFLDATSVYKAPVYLNISYIIGDDTLNDHLKINGSHNGVIKQFFLEEGERLTTIIRLQNEETNEIEGLEGSLRIVRNPDFTPTDNHGKNTFLSGVWKSDQTPLFRISVKDSIPQLFILKLYLNENFEYDKLYLKVKVISPSVGILMLEREVVINEGDTLFPSRKSMNIEFPELDVSIPGSYYFQLISNMAGNRINGIDKIEYKIALQ
jgi:hypothetical protein